MIKRKAFVAGSFYEATKDSLYRQLVDCFKHDIGPGELPDKNGQKERKTLGVVSPHAGYIFSGPVAAHHFLQLSKENNPNTVIILGPDHRGLGKDISIMARGQWETPLGLIEIDQQISEDILIHDEHKIIKDDSKAHLFEHSIEVQLPFLQFIYSKKHFKIIPICINNQRLDAMIYLADILYQVTKGQSCLFVASSDFSHYEDYITVKRKDMEAIDNILRMDSNLFYEKIHKNGATICGPGAIAVIIEICKKNGIKQGKLLKYATSGDISGVYDQVVGYSSIIFQLK